MDIDGKLRPLYLLRVLKERTDEDHTLTTAQLCKMLKEEFGIETFRTTIKGDIEVLQQAGFSVQVTRSTQNLSNHFPRTWKREWDDPKCYNIENLSFYQMIAHS